MKFTQKILLNNILKKNVFIKNDNIESFTNIVSKLYGVGLRDVETDSLGVITGMYLNYDKIRFSYSSYVFEYTKSELFLRHIDPIKIESSYFEKYILKEIIDKKAKPY